MREKGIDLTDRSPRRLDRAAAERADVVVTMGCGDECRYVPGKQYIDWKLADSKAKSVEEVRVVRDEIARSVAALVREVDALVSQ